MNLIRAILLVAENQGEPWFAKEIDIEGWDQKSIVYHVGLAIEKGLLNGEDCSLLGPNGADFFVNDLTYDGHDFIDKVRGQNNWDQITAAAKKSGAELTIETVKKIAIKPASSIPLPQASRPLMTSAPPKVFISYSHDTLAHQERVLDLADRLRADGIDAEIDQYNDAPPEGWPRWCERQIEAADFVLMVCTETYHRRVRGEEAPGKGLGVVWEAAIIHQLLYDAGMVSSKFVPVLFTDGSAEHIPTQIKGWNRYVVDSEGGYEGLYRRLTGQLQAPRPALGPIRTLPARERRWAEGSNEAALSPPASQSADRPGAGPARPRASLSPLIAEAIKEAMLARGLTQKELAIQSGCSRKTIQRALSGWMSELTVRRIMRVLAD